MNEEKFNLTESIEEQQRWFKSLMDEKELNISEKFHEVVNYYQRLNDCCLIEIQELIKELNIDKITRKTFLQELHIANSLSNSRFCYFEDDISLLRKEVEGHINNLENKRIFSALMV